MRAAKELKTNKTSIKNRIYPWIKLPTETSGLADVSMWENQSDNAAIHRVVFTIEPLDLVKIKIRFNPRNLRENPISALFSQGTEDDDEVTREFTFNKNNLLALQQFFVKLSEIEFFFPVIANHLLASLSTSQHITATQLNTLRQNTVPFSPHFLQLLQLGLFILLQRAYQQENPLYYHEDPITTFMGTPIFDIPLERVLQLDEKIEDANEILQLMRSHSEQGKNLFLNPNPTKNKVFSAEAIARIKQHPLCAKFILDYEEEQKQLAQVELSDVFYQALHDYLMALYHTGESQGSSFWGYMTPDGQEDYAKLSNCHNARKTFLNEIALRCSREERLALQQKTVSLPLRGGAAASTSDVKFITLVNGEEPYECVLTQQIFLWAMLLAKRPEIMVPEKLRRHPQARPFNLGGPNEADEIPEVIRIFMQHSPHNNGHPFFPAGSHVFVFFVPHRPGGNPQNQPPRPDRSPQN